ncbi:MAG: hypothetical protein LBR82_04120 [Desulfovibrio sp.]|jgi:hypothetical protein|nr:hypothetical protein [Desulfovibrio sp.]
MRPEGRPGELFAAFSRINARAFRDDRLVSCPVLSKSPDNGDVLRHFLAPGPRRPRGPLFLPVTVLRYAAANVGHLLFMLCTALFIRLLHFPMPAALRTRTGSRSANETANADGELLILDTFAVLPSLAREGAYRELYLVGLEDAVRAAGRETLTLSRLYGSRDPRVLWKALRVLARKGDALIEVHLLTCGDWARLVLHMLLYPVSLARLVRSLNKPEEECIREALIDCAGQCVLIGESRRLAARRLAFLLSSENSLQSPNATAAPAHPARIISWYENQTVNKAFQRGLAQAENEGARHVRVTGAQLFIWPDNLLNNHADDVEAELGLVPDCVLVNGPYFLPAHSRQNYAVGPALRYGDIFRSGVHRAGDGNAGCGAGNDPRTPQISRAAYAGKGPRSRHTSPVLVLLSYHPEETRRVLRLVQPAATDNPAAFAYRFHPATRIEDFASLLPPGARLDRGPLRESLDAAGAVIGAGSGALVEAAAVGIPVLAVEDPSGIPGLGLNYLPPYGKGALWESVRNPEEIAPALAGLRARLTDPERPAEVRAFRDLLFCEPTPERIRDSFNLG